MRKIMLLVIFVITMIALQIGQVNDVFAGREWNESRGNAFKCSMAGVWETPGGGLLTVVPLDPTGKRFSVIYDIPKLPRETYLLGLMQGTMEKIGPNLYEAIFYRYGVAEIDGVNEVVIFITAKSRTKFINCDERTTTSAFQIYYNHPVLGFIPTGDLITATGYSTRMDPMLMPSSDDLPDFEE